jgi:hypothetical protein
MMMKKLLILALVLGMTSAASAALSLGGVINGTIDVDTTGIVTVESDDTLGWEGYIGFDYTVVGVSGCVATSKAGQDSFVVADPLGYLGYYHIQAADMSEPFDSVVAGVQFEISVYGANLGDVYTIDRWNTAWDTILESGTVTVVPEPMTIALLGLGGLFLLRRRK